MLSVSPGVNGTRGCWLTVVGREPDEAVVLSALVRSIRWTALGVSVVLWGSSDGRAVI